MSSNNFKVVTFCVIYLLSGVNLSINNDEKSLKSVEVGEHSVFKNRYKRNYDSKDLKYETFSPCEDGFITFDRYIGLPYEEENYFNATAHFEKYKKNIPHAELNLRFDNPATITLDTRLARVRVLADKSFYIRTHVLPPTLNFTVRAPTMKPFPNLATVELSGKALCVSPKKWVPTLLGPPEETDQLSTRLLLSEENTPAESCGRSQLEGVALITNGEATELGVWPWHVAIFKRLPNSAKKKYRCGGTIISKSTIVTAAHCCVVEARPIPAHALTVVTGKYSLNRTEPHAKEYQVSKVIIHNRFSPRTMKNDIALYKLAESIVYSVYVQPVCLWSFKQVSKNYLFGETGTLVGWGSEKPHAPISDVLRSGTMKLVSDTTCLLSYPDFFEKFLSENTFCAGSIGQLGRSACTGDSGGGLVFSESLADGAPAWFLRGLVSISVSLNGTCDPSHYDVFTDTAQYLPWIRSHETT